MSTLGCALQVLSTLSVSHRVSHWRLTLAKSANVTEQLAPKELPASVSPDLGTWVLETEWCLRAFRASTLHAELSVQPWDFFVSSLCEYESKRAGDIAHLVERLPSMHRVLCSSAP